eukprot:jgi/Tetstr1/432809/TSEL_022161.t1
MVGARATVVGAAPTPSFAGLVAGFAADQSQLILGFRLAALLLLRCSAPVASRASPYCPSPEKAVLAFSRSVSRSVACLLKVSRRCMHLGHIREADLEELVLERREEAVDDVDGVVMLSGVEDAGRVDESLMPGGIEDESI